MLTDAWYAIIQAAVLFEGHDRKQAPLLRFIMKIMK